MGAAGILPSDTIKGILGPTAELVAVEDAEIVEESDDE
jgi:hypothetical protein